MAALKQQEYDWLLDLPQEFDDDQFASPKRQKQASKSTKVINGFIERIAITSVVLLFLSMCVACSSWVIARYVEINAKQYEIFTEKQTLKAAIKQRDELIVLKESFMTLDELERYATENLDMIKADESRKVVVEQAIDLGVAPVVQMQVADFAPEDDIQNNMLLNFGLWIKQLLTF